jgi:hypothetical protein
MELIGTAEFLGFETIVGWFLGCLIINVTHRDEKGKFTPLIFAITFSPNHPTVYFNKIAR